MIRSQFLFALLLAVVLLLSPAGCDDDCDCPTCVKPKVKQQIIRRDYEYAQGRVFDLGRLGSDSIRLGDSIQSLTLYQQTAPPTEPGAEAIYARIYVDASDTAYAHDEALSPAISVAPFGAQEFAYFTSRQWMPYLVFYAPHHYLPIGYSMRVWRAETQSVEEVGSSSGDTLVLKLLWPGAAYANDAHSTWPLMWRHVYDVPPGWTVDELNIRVFKGPPYYEQSPTILDYQEGTDGGSEGPYIEILGLDQYDQNGSKRPDNRVDERVEIYRPDFGLLIFPSRTPFDTDTTFTDADGTETYPLRARVPEVYTSKSENQKVAASRYFLRVTYYLYPEGYHRPF